MKSVLRMLGIYGIVFCAVCAHAGFLIGQTSSAPANAPEKPNVILVMTDDQGYGDLGCHGNPILKTPNIDSLSNESIRFTDFHVSPFCTPTRASLMTGHHAGRSGAFRTTGGRSLLHTDEKTIASLFAKNGYATGMVGKWHLGDNAPHRPQDRGFQDVVWHRCGGIGQASDYWGNTYFNDTYERVKPGSRIGAFEKFEGYCTDVFFEEGLRFVEDNKEKPFFLYLSLNAPHGPYRVPPEWAAPYKRDDVHNANFYGMIANVDHNMGILRDKLQELGLAENTILIFMTDNGTAAGAKFTGLEGHVVDGNGYNAGMRGKKSSIYEGGHRVPFFIHWPQGNLTGGKDVETLAAHIDVLPTLADLCGVPVSAEYAPDGVSLKPLLNETDAAWPRDHLIVQFHGGAWGRNPLDKPFADTVVLTERWRLTNSTKQELHDITVDPSQRTDVSPEYSEVISQLRGLYDPFWASVSPRLVNPAKIDLGNPDQNPTELCSQDWFMKSGYPPYSYSQIKKLPRVTAPWLVDVKQAGRYRLTLRQWPKAADKPVVAVRAKVNVSGQQKECKVDPGAHSVVLDLDLPAGPSELCTYLYDESGKSGGAYFTEVEWLGAKDSPLETEPPAKARPASAPNAALIEIETANAASEFTKLPLPASSSIKVVTASHTIKDAPLKSLVDGKLAQGYGPVFANGIQDGAYKADLGSVQTVTAVSSWSFNMSGTRGAQKISLYGSNSVADPGWDLSGFTPIGKIDTTEGAKASYTAASLHAVTGKSLGEFRWIVWAVSPVNANAGGENTAFQELAVTVSETNSATGKNELTGGNKKDAKGLGAIWFIGDSITQSNADGDPHGSPRKSLYDLLKADGYSFTYTGHHTSNIDGLPATGATPADNLYHYHTGLSGYLIGEATPTPNAKRLPGVVPNLDTYWQSGRLATVKPSIILIMLGTNDVGHGFELDSAAERLRKLLDKIYALPAVGQPKVFLATIPPNRRKEADRTNVMIFNEAVPQIVAEYKAKGKGRQIYFVDQFKPIDDDYKANMRGDNLHPNATGNDTMAKQWFDAIQNTVETDPDLRDDANSPTGTVDKPNAFPGVKTDFRGYDRYDQVKTAKGHFSIVCPKVAAPGKPWLWRSLFWEAIKPFSDADLKLVEQGYHVVLAHGNVHGHPSGNAKIDAAYQLLTTEYGFSKQCSMASMSRGTLSLFTWASVNPEKVSSIYVDNGVCNVDSWPGGKLVDGSGSVGSGDAKSWEGMKKAYGFTNDQQLLDAKVSPIDKLESLAEVGVPILMVCGSRDTAVPYEENDAIIEERYKKLGGSIKVIIEDKGHKHGMQDPTPVINFIKKHTAKSLSWSNDTQAD